MHSSAIFARHARILLPRSLRISPYSVRFFTADSSFDVFAKIKDQGDGKVDSAVGEAKKRKPSDKVIKLVDDILSLSLIEAADLCDLCQEKLSARSGGVPGRSPFPHPGAMFAGGGMMPSPMMGAQMPGVAPQQPAAPNTSEPAAGDSEASYDKPAEKKKEPAKSVVTIKLVSYNTEKKVLKKGVPLEQAEEIKKKMEATGAQVEFV